MTVQDSPDLSDLKAKAASAIAAHWKMFLAEGVLILVLGLLAIAQPVFSSLAVEIFVGWLFFVGGVARTVMLVRAKHLPGYWWSLLGAVLAIVVGLVLVAQPVQGILSLTIALTAIFVVEGVSAIFAGLDYRHHSSNWGWLLFSGVIDLALAGLIWQGLPSTAAWAVGLLAGVNLVFLGWAIVMLALSAPREADKV